MTAEISRRTAITAMVPAVALSGMVQAAPHFGPLAAGAADAALSPDAELIAACDRYMATEADIQRLFEVECAAAEAGDQQAHKEAERQQIALVRVLEDQRGQVNALPALTAAGLLAKARAHLTRCQFWDDGEPMEDSKELHSLCQDVLRLTGGAA